VRAAVLKIFVGTAKRGKKTARKLLLLSFPNAALPAKNPCVFDLERHHAISVADASAHSSSNAKALFRSQSITRLAVVQKRMIGKFCSKKTVPCRGTNDFSTGTGLAACSLIDVAASGQQRQTPQMSLHKL